MMNRGTTAGIFVFFLAIIVFAWVAFATKHAVYRIPTEPTASSTSSTETIATSSSTVARNSGDSLKVDAPMPNAIIASPLAISGRAKGWWYFEAQFPVELLDTQGNIVAQGTARAQSDWMTENFVPFSLTLDFSKPTTTAGLLIFKKDNPSDDPSKDVMFAIPVRFR